VHPFEISSTSVKRLSACQPLARLGAMQVDCPAFDSLLQGGRIRSEFHLVSKRNWALSPELEHESGSRHAPPVGVGPFAFVSPSTEIDTSRCSMWSSSSSPFLFQAHTGAPVKPDGFSDLFSVVSVFGGLAFIRLVKVMTQ